MLYNLDNTENKEKLIKPNQMLEAASISVRPLDQLPVTIDFFNGNKYTSSDGLEYHGYTPVAVGTISTDPNDENYISDEQWDMLARDAYDDVDAYTNRAMTVLGMFNLAPNFSAIPVWTKDQMMRAICAKIEQNLYTKPANAEIKVTLTQSSGGRTTNQPGRETFNPSDELNHKVQTYVDGSNIFELVADSFYAIVLDRNDYVTKAELQALLVAGEVPIEKLYTLDVSGWVPEKPGDGVNKKYVDVNIQDLQEQINALLVGDVELKTDHIALRNQDIESWTGLALHQRDVNTENKIVMTQHKNRIDSLDKRTGVPLQAYKTLGQSVSGASYTDIVDYDAVGNGTTDSLKGFNTETGVYTISQESSGDNVSIEATFKATGKPLPGQVIGYATIQKNGVTVNHPVTGNVIEIPLFIQTTAGSVFTVAIKDVNIRREVEDLTEFNVGDELKLVVKQTLAGLGSGFPLTISEVQFDFINNRVLAQTGESSGGATSTVVVNNIAAESISGTASTQQEINIENKAKFVEVDGRLDGVESAPIEYEIWDLVWSTDTLENYTTETEPTTLTGYDTFKAEVDGDNNLIGNTNVILSSSGIAKIQYLDGTAGLTLVFAINGTDNTVQVVNFDANSGKARIYGKRQTGVKYEN